MTGSAQHRMNDLLEPLHRGWIMHHFCRKFVPIDLAIHGRTRKCRFDRRRRLAFVNLVNGRVGIVNRNASFLEQFRGG